MLPCPGIFPFLPIVFRYNEANQRKYLTMSKLAVCPTAFTGESISSHLMLSQLPRVQLSLY